MKYPYVFPNQTYLRHLDDIQVTFKVFLDCFPEFVCYQEIYYNNSCSMGPQNITMRCLMNYTRRLEFKPNSQHPTIILRGPTLLSNVMIDTMDSPICI
jgi:hypothetical protein